MKSFFFLEDNGSGLFGAWGRMHEYAMRRHSEHNHPMAWYVSAYPDRTEMSDWLPRTNQYRAAAVIDDFGNLVRVPDPEGAHV